MLGPGDVRDAQRHHPFVPALPAPQRDSDTLNLSAFVQVFQNAILAHRARSLLVRYCGLTPLADGYAGALLCPLRPRHHLALGAYRTQSSGSAVVRGSGVASSQERAGSCALACFGSSGGHRAWHGGATNRKRPATALGSPTPKRPASSRASRSVLLAIPCLIRPPPARHKFPALDVPRGASCRCDRSVLVPGRRVPLRCLG
jgi:hypothetical protein